MDVATWNELERQGYDPNTVCETCSANMGITNSSSYTQGPCGQQHCWLTLNNEDT
jgi:hypothetical protein